MNQDDNTVNDAASDAIHQVLDNTWQQLLALTAHTFHPAAAAARLREMADQLDAIERRELDVETTLDVTSGELVVTHTAVPASSHDN